MKQISNKLVKQKTKINRDFENVYNNIEINEGETKKLLKKFKTIERAICNRKTIKLKTMRIFLKKYQS